MIPPGCYNAEQAGALVGKSPSWMYKKGATGVIPRSKLGNSVWWTPAQIAEIKRAAEQPAKPAEQPPAEQRRKTQAPKPAARRKREQPAPSGRTPNIPAGRGPIPVADRTVSRLYRQEAS